ncbi:MAG: T9SS type A sorting domain-containing protein [Bacteroidetes bacterium]|nr:T9SS type A sorting domain-containing protein [Bacteroidota bacterium]
MYTFKQTLLSAASILLLAGTSLAQSNDDEKIRIKIQINDDDRQVNVDTAFTDEAAFKQWMRDNNYDEPPMPKAPPAPPSPPTAPLPPAPPSKPESLKEKDVRIRIFSNKDKAELKLEMDKLNEELKESMKELSEMKFDVNINGDDDMDIVIKKFNGDKDSMFYSFSMPDCEKLKEEMEQLSDNIKSFNFSFDYNNEDDEQLKDKKQKRTSKVIIIEKDAKSESKKKEVEKENAPREKKEENDKSKNKENSKGNTSYELNPQNFELSPNPGKGQYKLSFDLTSTEPVTVKVVDFAGRQVFSDVAENFTGHYHNEFDITGKSKGTYLLQIRQGENWMHKKFLLN